MCTLTYLPLKDGRFFFTTNRDEGFRRQSATPPRLFSAHGFQALAPIDGQAGGTWIGMSKHGWLACLLNGAEFKHKHQPPYRISRGLVVRSLLLSADPIGDLDIADMSGIEPFTLLLIKQGAERLIREYRWDGAQLLYNSLDPEKPFVYSSSTLYDPVAQQNRADWFNRWLDRQPRSFDEVLDFHQMSGKDAENDILLKRKEVGTLSISSIEFNQGRAIFRYLEPATGPVESFELDLLSHAQ